MEGKKDYPSKGLTAKATIYLLATVKKSWNAMWKGINMPYFCTVSSLEITKHMKNYDIFICMFLIVTSSECYNDVHKDLLKSTLPVFIVRVKFTNVHAHLHTLHIHARLVNSISSATICYVTS